ncbi:hypothetical protein KDA11_01630 [Candidatus Saccharibacteria bacterium]|nr:hypothetical protein [Candidatus Saccharibacteria bacterium]
MKQSRKHNRNNAGAYPEEYKLSSEQLEQTYSTEQETAKTEIDNIAIT